MPAPLPKEMRDRFARPIVEGPTGRDAARRLQVSAATDGRRRRQIQRNGAATVAPMGRPSGTGKRVPHGGVFRALAMQDPKVTLFDLCDALAAAEGVTVRHSTIAGLLKRLGFCDTTEIMPKPGLCWMRCRKPCKTKGSNGFEMGVREVVR